MLRLLLGRDWVANRDAVLAKISTDVAHSMGNRILIVPELISHDAERRLCMRAGETASRFAEVLSFSRLANRVSESVGHAVEECLDNGGRVVAMAAATRQLYSKLKAYASVETRPEFLSSLVDAVDEFKRCCITSEDLMNASKCTSGSFAQKLEELALILEAYDSICARGKKDPRDQMTWLLEQLEESDFAERHVFYIDGFPDFTRQHFAILEHLICEASEVTVSLNTDMPGSQMLAFEKAGYTASELIKYAKEHGVNYELCIIEPHAKNLETIRENLFQGAVSQTADENLKLFQCTSVYEECRNAAYQVLQLINNGSRYREISLVCTDIATYKDTLNWVFHSCNVPLYLSGTEEILEKTAVNTVLTALDAALGGFVQEDVLRYLKSSLSPLTQADVDLIENYCILWGITGNRWLADWTYHPDGLGGEWTNRAAEQLEKLNKDRLMSIRPLEKLRNDFRKSEKLKDQVIALYNFLKEISLAERLAELADAMDLAGDNRSAQILNQLWEILLSAMEQLYDVLGETAWDSSAFTRLFTLLLSQYNVGTIPPVLDAVTVGPISSMRCHQADHVIILGAQEGLLPGYGGSNGVLTDFERVALREMGVPLSGGSIEGLQAEFSEIYGVFCAARRTITVSYCGGQPSYVYRRLDKMICHTEDPVKSVPLNAAEASALLVRAKEKETAVSLHLLDEYNDILEHSTYAIGNIQKNNVAALYGEQLRLSASQIDRQAECRFSYFMKYGMRAKERQEADVDPAEFGTYVHAVLENTARDVMAMGGFHNVTLEKTLELAQKHSHAYAADRFSELDSKRMEHLFQRNVQELEMVVRELWAELSVSAFEPVDFELAFGDNQKMPAIDIPGSTMSAQLRGFVDRVDAWSNGYTNYFRVVDYKTGRKDFDYCDVFNGIGLQMLLYLFALEQNGADLFGVNSMPVGVQYFPARSPIIPSNGRLTADEAEAQREKTLKRKGLVLSDHDILAAMEPENAPKRLSCKENKDGSITGDVADREQLSLLKRYIFNTLKDMVDEIASGNVSPNPYTRGSSHDACRFCPYGEVCHFATVQGRRNYKAMSAQSFWDEIGKEMKGNG